MKLLSWRFSRRNISWAFWLICLTIPTRAGADDGFTSYSEPAALPLAEENAVVPPTGLQAFKMVAGVRRAVKESALKIEISGDSKLDSDIRALAPSSRLAVQYRNKNSTYKTYIGGYYQQKHASETVEKLLFNISSSPPVDLPSGVTVRGQLNIGGDELSSMDDLSLIYGAELNASKQWVNKNLIALDASIAGPDNISMNVSGRASIRLIPKCDTYWMAPKILHSFSNGDAKSFQKYSFQIEIRPNEAFILNATGTLKNDMEATLSFSLSRLFNI